MNKYFDKWLEFFDTDDYFIFGSIFAVLGFIVALLIYIPIHIFRPFFLSIYYLIRYWVGD